MHFLILNENTHLNIYYSKENFIVHATIKIFIPLHSKYFEKTAIKFVLVQLTSDYNQSILCVKQNIEIFKLRGMKKICGILCKKNKTLFK